ncbi:MAG: MarR family winged helix-turn-helix transcriptional regulator [Henriciella sp.]|uniref:MarR family winged helix-turn-helix transcriptional regulator n=1 Tax=Henriciella sp. TaxID=1968823 RepID=UPI0032EB0509
MSEPSDQNTVTPSDAALFFQLFNEIGIISQLASSSFEKALLHGLTQAQFNVLNHCVRLGDDKTPAHLAAAFQVTRGTMTSTLARLEAKSFIKVEPDPNDGRSKRVFLTAAGRAARADSLAAAAPLLSRVAIEFSREEAEDLLGPLQALRQWLDAERDADFDGV